MAILIIQREGEPEEIFPIEKDEISIGRNDPSTGILNDIELPDRTVSRRHARIVKDKGVFYIDDLGSENHVFVNSRQVRRVALADGDVISIGRHCFVFQAQDLVTTDPASFQAGGIDPCKTLDLNYLIFRRLSDLLVTATSVPEFLGSAMDLIMESIRSSSGVLLLCEPDGSIRVEVSRGENPLWNERTVREALRSKKSIMTSQDSPSVSPAETQGSIAPSALCAPLIHEGETLGAIYLEDRMGFHFGEDKLILLTVAANQVASGLEKATLNERLHREVVNRKNLERFLSPRVAERIAEDCASHGKIALRSTRLTATILFADIQGFTLLTERLEAEEVAVLLTRYFTLMTDILFRWEGTLDKYLGDGLLAIFGAPFACDDHAERAVRCGLEMLKEQRKFVAGLPEEKRFSIRIGVNTGEVVAGYLGAPQRMEYTVLGESVVIAYRLQALAEPGTIYLGKQTRDLVEDVLSVQYVDRMKTPKGRKEIEVYRLLPE